MDLLLPAFRWVFVACMFYTIVSDFRALIIPNSIVAALAAAFAAFAAIYLEPGAIWAHVEVAAVLFLLFTAFFVAGWIAGGDVKLMAAVGLWMGPEHVLHFVLLTALLGSVLALALLLIRKYGDLARGALDSNRLLRRMGTLAEHGQCPYGVAIGIAALLSSSGLFQQ
jgi:prepilin peptidase CpaA